MGLPEAGLRRGLAIATALTVSLSACLSDKGEAPADSHDPAEVRHACESMGIAHCRRLALCAPAMLFMEFLDEERCVAMLSPWCYEAGLEGQPIGANFLASCAAAISTMKCEDFVSDVTPDACRTPPGTLGYREHCVFSTQCQTGVCASSGHCGICTYPTSRWGSQVPPVECNRPPSDDEIKEMREPIGIPGLAGSYHRPDTCGNGTRCFALEGTDPPHGECRPIVYMGEDCTSHPCSYLGRCVDGICVRAGHEGEVCEHHVDCDWLSGFLCNHEGICRARDRVAPKDSCLYHDIFPLCSGLFCSSGVCPELLHPGASCVEYNGTNVKSVCEWPSQCLDGLCVPATPDSCAETR